VTKAFTSKTHHDATDVRALFLAVVACGIELASWMLILRWPSWRCVVIATFTSIASFPSLPCANMYLFRRNCHGIIYNSNIVPNHWAGVFKRVDIRVYH
jgi:hypothetical protein